VGGLATYSFGAGTYIGKSICEYDVERARQLLFSAAAKKRGCFATDVLIEIRKTRRKASHKEVHEIARRDDSDIVLKQKRKSAQSLPGEDHNLERAGRIF